MHLPKMDVLIHDTVCCIKMTQKRRLSSKEFNKKTLERDSVRKVWQGIEVDIVPFLIEIVPQSLQIARFKKFGTRNPIRTITATVSQARRIEPCVSHAHTHRNALYDITAHSR